MSGPFSSVNGFSIIEGSLLIPLVGAWTADVALASDQAVSGRVSVVVGNLTLSGSVIRSTAYGGQTKARLVAGAGGWRTEIGAQGYGSPSGVKLSTVVQDAANACGETVNVASDTTIGPGYARVADIASDVLWQLLGQQIIPAWRVDTGGTTLLSPWPTKPVRSTFTVTDQRPDQGIAVIATEDYAAWLPGCTFTSPLLDGQFTNMGVHYIWTRDGNFRFEVMTGADNLTASFDAIVQKQVAPTRFYGRYSYTISNPSSSTVDASPVDKSLGLPDLQSVPIVADSISTYVPPDGGKCHIQFLDGVPTQPICVWTDEAPTMASILGGSNPVARQGDPTTSFLQPTLPIQGLLNGQPFTGVITVVNPISGRIVSGSPVVSTK